MGTQLHIPEAGAAQALGSAGDLPAGFLSGSGLETAGPFQSGKRASSFPAASRPWEFFALVILTRVFFPPFLSRSSPCRTQPH